MSSARRTLPAVEPTALDTHGRGARTNASGRYEAHARAYGDDGWESLTEEPALKTQAFEGAAKSIITRNNSPDVGFDRSINPYRGCEHGCAYCYARPTHAFLGLSPGLDFESRIFVKTNAADLLRRELSEPSYRPGVIALGANTDAYQPVERGYRLTRRILEVLAEFGHPVGIVTKSALVLRDIDVLTTLARRNLVKVAVSVTTLDGDLARRLEPRAGAPHKRLKALEGLSRAGVPTLAMVAPVIPGLNDHEVEAILKAVAGAGAKEAAYVMLRLPLEVKDIFRSWLMSEAPERAGRVLSLIRDVRQGQENDAAFGRRMVGTGPYAWAIGRRFELACRRLGLNRERAKLSIDYFRPPARPGDQLRLL